MRKVPITCIGCGKTYEIEIKDLDKVDDHTFVAKCDCGATTQFTGDPGDSKMPFKDINELLSKIPEILDQYRRTRAKGVDTGIGEAIAATSKELAFELLSNDPKLREALAKVVKQNLDAYLVHFTEGDEEPQKS